MEIRICICGKARYTEGRQCNSPPPKIFANFMKCLGNFAKIVSRVVLDQPLTGLLE